MISERFTILSDMFKSFKKLLFVQESEILEYIDVAQVRIIFYILKKIIYKKIIYKIIASFKRLFLKTA